MKKMIFIKCCSRKPGAQADASAVMIILFLQTFSCLFSAWYWAKVHLQENFESIFYQKKLWNDTLFQIKKRGLVAMVGARGLIPIACLILT